jgi:type 2 lantibiotic biosynthesis protein LanM
MTGLVPETVEVPEYDAIEVSSWHLARTFVERLEQLRGDMPPPRTYDTELAERRLARWRSAPLLLDGAEPIDPAVLHECAEEELRAVLGGAPSSGAAPDYEWARWLEAAYAAPDELQRAPRPQYPDTPFLVAVDPALAVARARVEESARAVFGSHPAAPFDAESVVDVLFAAVARQVQLVLGPSVVLELNAARVTGTLDGETPHARYKAYLKGLAEPQEGLRLLRQYPVMARQLVTLLLNWVSSSVELLRRLAADWGTLSHEFDLRPTTLVDFEPVGDPHHGGRRVAICTFESGFRIVYKPRPTANELHFQNVLRWVNAQTTIPTLRTLKVVDRGLYGWVEFAEPRHCQSEAELRAFYRRQGAQLAILHALAAVDFHYENVIAAGDQPVLVDLESILQAPLEFSVEVLNPSEQRASALTSQSVLRIGLLPTPPTGDDDADGPDMSGLGAVQGQRTAMRLPHWADEGTDVMHQVLDRATISNVQSRPMPPNSELSVLGFTEDIVAGFTETYDAFSRHRATLLADGGPLAPLRVVETRCILRPTVAYALLLRSSLHPHYLGDGLDREFRFNRLLGGEDARWKAHMTDITAAEREDLWALDIPHFLTRPGSRDLWTRSGKRIANVLPDTGLAAVTRRLERMCDDDRDLQSWMIRMSIATATLSARTKTAVEYPVLARPRVPTGDALAAAVAIGERLEGLAIREHDTATWIGLTGSERGQRWWISPVTAELYEGLAGISLFLAYLGSVSGEARHEALARAAVRTMQAQVQRGGLGRSIGGFGGLGGHVYAMTHLGVLLDDERLLLEAENAVRSLSERIDEDSSYDVLAGAAGCIAALLVLDDVVGSREAIEVAMHAGDHLLNTATKLPEGLGWTLEQISSRPLGGFAHGTAGIAWALFALAAATGEERFREAAAEATRYDRSLFSPAAGAWLDAREGLALPPGVDPDGMRSLTHWCHGSAGIGLARLRSRAHWDDGFVRKEIETAVADAIGRGFGINHCLCHGDLGNIELLVEAQRAFPDAHLRTTIERLSADILESLAERGCMTGHLLGLEAPGLMMGTAGIGYGLLRLAAPDRVPSVLVLDPPVT